MRGHNEDNFIIAELTKQSRSLMEADRERPVGPGGLLFGVCDGLGGAAAGEVASQMAIDAIYEHMTLGGAPKDRDDFAVRLMRSLETGNAWIRSEASREPTWLGMGTTATVAGLRDDHLFIGQVGDSRAYILRGDRLVQVTRDQSLVNELVESLQLTEEEAETFEHRNVVLQALGIADAVQVEMTCVVLRKGDTLMLCSDGLSGMIRNDEIREVLSANEDPLEACMALIDRANEAGGNDNITVVVARFDGTGLQDAMLADIEGLKYQKYDGPPRYLSDSQTAPESRSGATDVDESRPSSRAPSNSVPGEPNVQSGNVPVSRGDPEYSTEGDDLPRLSDRSWLQIPMRGSPKWPTSMILVSALICVGLAGYYLLK